MQLVGCHAMCMQLVSYWYSAGNPHSFFFASIVTLVCSIDSGLPLLSPVATRATPDYIMLV